MAADRLVHVAVAVPRLELDRPFTYSLPSGMEAPLGSLVSVPFHGRTVKGWALGPTAERPSRVLPVRRVLSRTPVFGEADLRLYRWLADRYVAPLATAIDRAHPPRVASEEEAAPPAPVPAPRLRPEPVLHGYEGGEDLRRAARSAAGSFLLRPLPGEEAAACLEAVSACVEGGRDAVVVVPEADPLPGTAGAVLDAFGGSALLLAGGDRRGRYRAWLDVLAGRYRVVVGTRPAVFAPVPRMGLVWVNREAHAAHREERSPYYRSREVALARARLAEGVCVLSALAPSGAAVAEAETGRARVVRASRARERRAAPLVETARTEREDRSRRLGGALHDAAGAFLLLSRRGYGVAQVCRRCGEPAACEACSGPIAVREGTAACAVCGREARCRACGGGDFGLDRGGTERLEEWAGHVTSLPVRRVDERHRAVPPGRDRVVVATAAGVKDFGPVGVGLVAILDPDRALRRAGIDAPEQAVATWMEAAAWAGPRDEGGRVLVQTANPSEPAIQALIRWDPWHFHRSERARREAAGFPPGFPVFRVAGTAALPDELRALSPVTLLSTAVGEQAVCLVTLRPEALREFRARVVGLAEDGVVTRVEAEPQL